MKTLKALLPLAIVLLGLTGAQAETWRFNPSDSHRLHEALSRVKSGDEIVFERGRYDLPTGLRLTGLVNVEVRGEGRVELIVDSRYDPVLDLTDCERVEIRGLRARHKEPLDEYECEGAVIRLDSCTKIGIYDNHLNGCGAAGVYATKSGDILIEGNRIFNNTYAGVWFWDSNAYVVDNDIYDNAAALSSGGNSRITMMGNRIKDNRGNAYTGLDSIRKQIR